MQGMYDNITTKARNWEIEEYYSKFLITASEVVYYHLKADFNK